MPKGKDINRWRYEFDCKKCENLKEIHDGVRNGLYCVVMVEEEKNRPPDWNPFNTDGTISPKSKDTKTIHADEDFCLRCNSYKEKENEQQQ